MENNWEDFLRNRSYVESGKRCVSYGEVAIMLREYFGIRVRKKEGEIWVESVEGIIEMLKEEGKVNI